MTLATDGSIRETAPKLRVLRDVAYVPGPRVNPRQRLDLYLPEGSRSAFPVLIAVPGGGLVEGDKANSVQIGERFARAGVDESPDVLHGEAVRCEMAPVSRVLLGRPRRTAARQTHLG